MSDSKEWVTIKIPKAIRKEAKADDRTYGEIMQAGLGEGELQGHEVDPEAIAESVADHLNDYEWHVDTEQVSEEVVQKFDIEDLAGDISKTLGSDLEMSAYRGTKDALESVKR